MRLPPRAALGLALLVVAGAVGFGVSRIRIPELAGPPAEAIYEYPGSGPRNCQPAVFLGTDRAGGGTLPIRIGPGDAYRIRNELTHGDTFLVFEHRGTWAGIVYGHNREVCGSREKREVRAARQGWVEARHVAYLPN